jgi:hypothetical protein
MTSIKELFDPHLHLCLEIFADSIKKCNDFGSDKWGITIWAPDDWRLVMGSLIVATIESGTVWLALDIPSDAERSAIEKVKYWGWSHQYQYKRPPSVSGYYLPLKERHIRQWPKIARLHHRYLAKVAETYKHLRKSSQATHSNQPIEAIETELGIELPRPKY